MNTYRVTDTGLSIQRALRQMLGTVESSHWVTLSCHSAKSLTQAKDALRLWSLDLISRLFRSPAFTEIPLAKLFSFVALPEYTRSGDPHYHLVLWLHPDRRAWFGRCAGSLWRHIVPSGTSDIQLIGATDLDRAKVITYGTKYANRPFSYDNFITSNMLYLPEFVG